MKDRAGATHLLDASSRTHMVLARPAVDAGADSWSDLRHALSSDGRRATWVDGDAARLRELDGAHTRDVRTGGLAARRSEIAGDTLVALFEHDLIVMRFSTGVELAHPHHVDDFLLADDGKTLAWEDGAASLQTVVLFDAEHGREVRHVAIEDDPQSAAPRYGGVCGGGRFSLGRPPSNLRGTVLSVERSCSLIDNATVELETGVLLGFRSATPADDYAEGQRRATACARAHLSCPDATDVAWVGPRRAVMTETSGKLVVVDVATGRRVATLDGAGDTSMGHDFAVSPDRKTVGAVDRASIAHLWDSATGKTRWAGPSDRRLGEHAAPW
jgi:hypothetical protein